jgi:hypothetical protein
MSIVVYGIGEGLVSVLPIMTGGAAALKAGGPSNFAAQEERAKRASLSVPIATKSVPPPPLSRRFAALTTAAPPACSKLFSNLGTAFEEVIMTHFSSKSQVSDRVMAKLISGLEIEFGSRAAQGLAQHFLEAEEVDFHWDARQSEWWLGGYQTEDDEEIELDRILIRGVLDGGWFVATCIVDGDGNPHGMLGCRNFADEKSAIEAFDNAAWL